MHTCRFFAWIVLFGIRPYMCLFPNLNHDKFPLIQLGTAAVLCALSVPLECLADRRTVAVKTADKAAMKAFKARLKDGPAKSIYSPHPNADADEELENPADVAENAEAGASSVPEISIGEGKEQQGEGKDGEDGGAEAVGDDDYDSDLPPCTHFIPPDVFGWLSVAEYESLLILYENHEFAPDRLPRSRIVEDLENHFLRNQCPGSFLRSLRSLRSFVLLAH